MEDRRGEPVGRGALRVYVAAVCAASAGGLAFAAAVGGGFRSPLLVLLLAGLAALAGTQPVKFPRHKTELTVTHPFIFLAIASLGAFEASLVAAAGLASVVWAQAKHRRFLRIAFNVGSVVLATVVASWSYVSGGGLAAGPTGARMAPLLLAATVFFVMNTGLVTFAIAIERGSRLVEVWKESFLWTAASYFTGVTVAGFLLLVLDHLGPLSLALGIPPCWLLVAYYKSHRARLEEQERRIREVEGLNADLERKVADRTRELAAALAHIEETNASLRDANARLVEASRAKSLFLANISHELRTPLNAVIGFSDYLIGPDFDNLTPRQHGFLCDIRDSGVHLLQLINDILDLSKIEAGKMEVRIAEFPAEDALRETVAMVRRQAEQKRLLLGASCAPGLGLVRVDPKMLRQVLANLLSNAVKFTPEGGRVDALVRRDGDDLVVAVSDTGIGIPEEACARIFEEFFQIDGSYARKYEGTGLGLALVKRIVDLHGGRVSVSSEVGRGSRFTCRFPGAAVAAPPAPEIAPPSLPRPAPPVAPKPRTRGRFRVLVVDENAVSRRLVRNVLRSRGNEVDEASSASQGLVAAARERPDLVVLDLGIEGEDPVRAVRKFLEDPVTVGIPVVALSDPAGGAVERGALAAGCAGAIAKPIRLSTFPDQILTFFHATKGAA